MHRPCRQLKRRTHLWAILGASILTSIGSVYMVQVLHGIGNSQQLPQLGDEPSYNDQNHQHQVAGNASVHIKSWETHSTTSNVNVSQPSAGVVPTSTDVDSTASIIEPAVMNQEDSNPPTYSTTIEQPQDAEYMGLHLTSDAQTLGTTAPEFISTTLDWWPLEEEGWGNSSILNADLSHPNLLVAAQGLSPFFLRVGGSQADEIVYNFHGRDNNASKNSTRAMKKIASQCEEKPQKCLSKERWEEALHFARRVGARIVFTLAYVGHTRDAEGRNDQHDWDSSNARQFLEYTANSKHAKMGTIYGFELGNELRHKGKVQNITRIVNAYKELREMVNEIWSSNEERKQYHKPKILGPASTGKGETATLIAELGPYIDIASYHKYHGGGKDSKVPKYARHPTFYSHPMKLSGPGEVVQKHMMNKNNNSSRSSDAQLWIGEGAMLYNSGRRGLTDTFHGSMWFVNLLGALAKTKPVEHSVYCRQAILGGYYELISHETLIPNPDYWVSYVWKHVVGTKAVGPIVSPQREDSVKLSSQVTFGCCERPGADSHLVHSFCAKSNNGDVVLVVINISESEAIDLNVTMAGKRRTEYLLHPNKKGLESKEVLLNGKVMWIENGILPEIHGVPRKQSEAFRIPPISIAFLVVHGAGVKECIGA